nr:MAG TPA: hypothetical protein [Caudoviricetes sp.]
MRHMISRQELSYCVVNNNLKIIDLMTISN